MTGRMYSDRKAEPHREHRDIDYYGAPYVWEVSLHDFETDEREYDEEGNIAKCPFFPDPPGGYCGHSWKHCKYGCPMRKQYEGAISPEQLIRDAEAGLVVA